jgi:4-hydroxybenzoate polyprenyltransferase
LSGKARAANAGADSQVLPDARPASLILRLTPPAALPFVQLARLDRPIGWQLLLAPCWQSAALAGLASRTGPDLVHLALFLIGAIAMRGAGSTDIDILDR